MGSGEMTACSMICVSDQWARVLSQKIAAATD
jgi:hypothetical protein